MIVRFVDIGGIVNHHCLNFKYLLFSSICIFKNKHIVYFIVFHHFA